MNTGGQNDGTTTDKRYSTVTVTVLDGDGTLLNFQRKAGTTCQSRESRIDGRTTNRHEVKALMENLDAQVVDIPCCGLYSDLTVQRFDLLPCYLATLLPCYLVATLLHSRTHDG